MDSCRCEFSHFTDSRNLEKWYNPGTSVSLSVKSQYWFAPSRKIGSIALWLSFSLSTERDRNTETNIGTSIYIYLHLSLYLLPVSVYTHTPTPTHLIAWQIVDPHFLINSLHLISLTSFLLSWSHCIPFSSAKLNLFLPPIPSWFISKTAFCLFSTLSCLCPILSLPFPFFYFPPPLLSPCVSLNTHCYSRWPWYP